MLSNTSVNAGIRLITEASMKAFSKDGMIRNIEQQRTVFEEEESITNVLSPDQENAQLEGRDFIPDMDRAKERSEILFRTGVECRLRSAWAFYKAGAELECIRMLILALSSICWAVGWKEAESYLCQQNDVLYERSHSKK